MDLLVSDDPQNKLRERCLRQARKALPRDGSQAASRLDALVPPLMQLSLLDDDDGWRAFFADAMPGWLADAFLFDVLPEIARRLGTGWADDTMSFVEVSIGSARLHEMVRRLGARAARDASTPAIPILVPPWEQHVLAATFAAHRVNDAGRRAVMLTGLTPEQAVRMPIVQSAPAGMVSAPDRPARGRLEMYLKALRRGLKNPIPIIAGGSGFERPYMDTCRTAGAICGVNDPVEALRACGVALKGSSRGEARREDLVFAPAGEDG